jgi:hypothetical protein
MWILFFKRIAAKKEVLRTAALYCFITFKTVYGLELTEWINGLFLLSLVL